ncbi:MAG: hypothetical protein QOI54_2398 [Actinomycetota bacterium]|nr:hypothetical protein [Actinomycetota bacterium]
MTVAAGVDIGNSTTEVVIGRVTGRGVDILAAGRAPTRREKGSDASLDGATALLRRLEREVGGTVQVAVAAPLRPVHTRTVTLPEPEADTGRLRIVRSGVRTAGGTGFGVGRPVVVGEMPSGADPIVAVVPAAVGFRAALEPLRRLRDAGRLAAVVLENDEAVLVANRLGDGQLPGVPVVDEVPAAEVCGALLVAVEVASAAGALRTVGDPLRLLDVLALDDAERQHAARLSAGLADSSNAVVALDLARAGQPLGPLGWIELAADGGRRRVTLAAGHQAVSAGAVGLVRSYALPPDEVPREVDDLLTVDLAGIADSVLARVGAAASRAVALAALHADAPYADPATALRDRLGVPVHTASSEWAAGRLGALTTPGAEPGAVVVDLGGGTVDVVGEESAVVAAGAGELLTVSVGALAGATRAAAEWVKRGPASRVESPHLLLGEDGARQFLERPAAPETLGALVVRGPAGLLPFGHRLSPGEWRALRLRLKAEVLGGNVARALRTLGVRPRTVVVVGGPAADDEVLVSVARALPDGVVVGRGDAGGSLGHRHVVAYGLLLTLAR